MSTVEATIARTAAVRLAALAPTLPEQVDRLLLAGAADRPPRRFLDPVSVSLAAVVVSIASLGWTIYRDLKLNQPKQEPPPPEAVARRLRMEVVKMDLPATFPQDQLNKVIETVVTVAKEVTSRGDPPAT